MRLKVRCEQCNQLYDIPYSRNLKTISVYLHFSKCPHCGYKQNSAIDDKKHCEVCNVPTVKNQRLCHICYMNKYRNKEKLSIAKVYCKFCKKNIERKRNGDSYVCEECHKEKVRVYNNTINLYNKASNITK